MTDFTVRRYPALTSTMDEAHRLAGEGAADRTVVVARQQSAARGRQGRPWTSPEGNLHVSILLRPGLPVPRLAELSFVVGLAVADMVDAALPDGRARLKWPNDVLVAGAKIAGILVELAGDAAIIGIGVNVVAAPDGVPYPATSLRDGGAAADADAVLDALLAALDRRLADWHAAGFAAVRPAWLARGPAVGDLVRIRVGDRIGEGIFAGLDTDGAMLLRDGTATRRMIAGEVT